MSIPLGGTFLSAIPEAHVDGRAATWAIPTGVVAILLWLGAVLWSVGLLTWIPGPRLASLLCQIAGTLTVISSSSLLARRIQQSSAAGHDRLAGGQYAVVQATRQIQREQRDALREVRDQIADMQRLILAAGERSEQRDQELAKEMARCAEDLLVRLQTFGDEQWAGGYEARDNDSPDKPPPPRPTICRPRPAFTE